MTIYSPGDALTAEIADRLAHRIHFCHDFEFQTSKLYDSQRLYIAQDCTLVAIYAEFKTAPVGCDAICNVRKNGVQLFSGADRPTLAAGTTTLEKTGISEAFSKGDYLEWEDVQNGSSTAGGYGVIVLVFK